MIRKFLLEFNLDNVESRVNVPLGVGKALHRFAIVFLGEVSYKDD